MANDSVLDTLLNAAHKIGKAARSVGTGVQTAVDTARSYTDAQDQKAALEQFEALKDRVSNQTSSAYTGVRQWVATMDQTLRGVPPKLAHAMTTYAQLQEIAAVKGANGIRELDACNAKAAEINATLASTPDADFTAASTEFDQLLIVAGNALDTFPDNEDDVKRALISAHSTLTDITSISGRATAAEKLVVTNIKDATVTARGADATLAALNQALTEVDTAVNGGNWQVGGVTLHNWSLDAAAFQHAEEDAARNLSKQASAPESIEGLFSTLFSRAERLKLLGDTELAETSREFMDAARARPCDVPAAERLKDKFFNRMGELTRK